jgi:hypothetical protein
VSLLTDGPVARPGHLEDPTLLNQQEVTNLIQQIVDMRRGADLLLARPDVDAKRLALCRAQLQHQRGWVSEVELAIRTAEGGCPDVLRTHAGILLLAAPPNGHRRHQVGRGTSNGRRPQFRQK